MKTTVEFLDGLRARHGLTSDYQLAKVLGVGQTNISRYRNRGGTMDDEIAVRAAGLLELPVPYVLACIQAERSTSDVVKKAWSKAAKVLAGTAVVLLLGCIAPAPFDIIVSARTAHAENIHYAHFATLILAAFMLLVWHGRARPGAAAPVR